MKVFSGLLATSRTSVAGVCCCRMVTIMFFIFNMISDLPALSRAGYPDMRCHPVLGQICRVSRKRLVSPGPLKGAFALRLLRRLGAGSSHSRTAAARFSSSRRRLTGIFASLRSGRICLHGLWSRAVRAFRMKSQLPIHAVQCVCGSAHSICWSSRQWQFPVGQGTTDSPRASFLGEVSCG